MSEGSEYSDQEGSDVSECDENGSVALQALLGETTEYDVNDDWIDLYVQPAHVRSKKLRRLLEQLFVSHPPREITINFPWGDRDEEDSPSESALAILGQIAVVQPDVPISVAVWSVGNADVSSALKDVRRFPQNVSMAEIVVDDESGAHVPPDVWSGHPRLKTVYFGKSKIGRPTE